MAGEWRQISGSEFCDICGQESRTGPGWRRTSPWRGRGVFQIKHTRTSNTVYTPLRFWNVRKSQGIQFLDILNAFISRLTRRAEQHRSRPAALIGGFWYFFALIGPDKSEWCSPARRTEMLLQTFRSWDLLPSDQYYELWYWIKTLQMINCLYY